MLVEFTITNFRSIKESQTFSMEPINKFKELPNNVANINGNKILKTSAIYGKNASGKSNLVIALRALVYLVENSALYKNNSKILCYEPFKFDKQSNHEPVTFDIVFYGKDKIKYRYKVIYTDEKIKEEHLIYYPKKQPKELFHRDENGNIKTKLAIRNKIRGVVKNLYPNQLFLSKIGTENIEEFINPYMFFEEYCFVNILEQSCSLCDKRLIDLHTRMLFDNKDSKHIENINKLMQIADTGINGIVIKENKEEDFKLPESIDPEKKKKFMEENRFQIFAKHNQYENGNFVNETNLEFDDESSGTNRLLAVGGLILDALSDGTTLIIDELERSLHPFLTKILIELFNNVKTNPKNAQLIFTTHDTSILTNELFRRDQIWFVEKDEKGFSSFYSLGEITGVRKDVPYHKYYMKGLFGGVPNVNVYDFNFSN